LVSFFETGGRKPMERAAIASVVVEEYMIRSMWIVGSDTM
jgi:hypothetical protein